MITNGFVGTATTHYTDKDDGVTYIQGYNVEENSYNFNGIKKVTYSFHRQHQKSCLKEGDLLTVQTGDVGLTTVVPKSLAGANCHALIISRFKKNKVFPLYYSYYFNSLTGRNRLKEFETGTTMKHLNIGDMIHWKIPFPKSKSEQQAIARVLSDTDALIENLEKLIAKKKAIKQGSMQQLLTGKKRLPGFSGEWKTKKVGEIGELTMGQSPPGTSYTSNEKYYPLINGAIELREDGIFISKYTREPTRFAEIGDLLFCIRATIGNIQISDQRYCIGRGVASVRVNTYINKFYTIYQLSDLFKKMLQQSEGGVIKGLRKDDLADFNINFPSTNKEQTAIANILSDMNAKIEKLEQKRDKYISIKQGMMQQLLTGKIRLVKNGDN
jgi:type I restriction enzyme S subunit